MNAVAYIFRKQSLQRFALILILFVCITLVFHWWKWDDVTSRHRKYSEVAAIQSSNQSCIPKKNVVFLKTHKCASSTIQNIFLRYADKNKLTLVLPPLSDTNYLSSTKPFSSTVFKHVPWSSLGYNIVCHHMVFNYTEVKAIMPVDTVYVTIVRDPASVFESLYTYGNLKEFYNLTFMQYVSSVNESTNTEQLKKRSGGNLGPNQMMYDFGMDPSQFWDSSEVSKVIENIDRQFDLVMLAEMFEESLILLKRLLCWNLDDMVSFALNVREDHYRTPLNKTTRDILNRWNSADRLLYDHFVKKFLKTLGSQLGKDFARDIQSLKKIRQDWHSKCIEEIVSIGNKTGKVNKMVLSYKLRKDAFHNPTCNNLVKSEIQYTNEMRKKQLLRSISDKDMPAVEEMLEDYGINLPDMIDVEREDLDNVVLALSKLARNKDGGFFPVQVRGPQRV